MCQAVREDALSSPIWRGITNTPRHFLQNFEPPTTFSQKRCSSCLSTQHFSGLGGGCAVLEEVRERLFLQSVGLSDYSAPVRGDNDGVFCLSHDAFPDVRQHRIAHDHPEPVHLGDQGFRIRVKSLTPPARERERSERGLHLGEELRDILMGLPLPYDPEYVPAALATDLARPHRCERLYRQDHPLFHDRLVLRFDVRYAQARVA